MPNADVTLSYLHRVNFKVRCTFSLYINWAMVKYINFTSHPKHATGDHIKLSNRKFLRDIHEKRKKLQKLL